MKKKEHVGWHVDANDPNTASYDLMRYNLFNGVQAFAFKYASSGIVNIAHNTTEVSTSKYVPDQINMAASSSLTNQN